MRHPEQGNRFLGCAVDDADKALTGAEQVHVQVPVLRVGKHPVQPTVEVVAQQGAGGPVGIVFDEAGRKHDLHIARTLTGLVAPIAAERLGRLAGRDLAVDVLTVPNPDVTAVDAAVAGARPPGAATSAIAKTAKTRIAERMVSLRWCSLKW